MAKRLTFFSPNSSDQVKVPMRKSTKRLVKSIPGYMQLLKDFDDSKYHSMTIQKYSNTQLSMCLKVLLSILMSK